MLMLRVLCHRDLEPFNFLLYRDGRLVLADFGVACVDQRERAFQRSYDFYFQLDNRYTMLYGS